MSEVLAWGRRSRVALGFLLGWLVAHIFFGGTAIVGLTASTIWECAK